MAPGDTVDVLYHSYSESGLELGLQHWDDFDTGASSSYRLTDATRGGTEGGGAPAPGDALFAPGPQHTVTEISWFGYDAVLDGEDIVIVFDEHTYSGYLWAEIAIDWVGVASPAGGAEADSFLPVTPPPLAPGMTELLPAPDPDHAHQLKVMRIR